MWHSGADHEKHESDEKDLRYRLKTGYKSGLGASPPVSFRHATKAAWAQAHRSPSATSRNRLGREPTGLLPPPHDSGLGAGPPVSLPRWGNSN